MGCVSSKILSKSASFQEQVNKSFQKRSNVIEEIILANSKSTGDQFPAQLCTTNTVTRRIRATTFQSDETTQNSDNKPRLTISETIGAASPSADWTKIEMINTWELLAGLEEENGVNEQGQTATTQPQIQQENDFILMKFNSESTVGKTKSFRTVEDYDALVAVSSNSVSEMTELSSKSTEAAGESTSTDEAIRDEQESSLSSSTSGAKRRAMVKELAELKLPGFEFAKCGSLKEWLLKGGQIFSPGSYATPKFGSVSPSEASVGEQSGDHAVFDPELIAQFEQAMKQLSLDEDHILKEIVKSLEEVQEEENLKFQSSEEPKKAQD